MLQPAERLRIISRIKTVVLKHHFNIGNIDLAGWCQEVDERTPALMKAEDDKSFEVGIHDLLSKLKSSHTDFYGGDRKNIQQTHARDRPPPSRGRLGTQPRKGFGVFV